MKATELNQGNFDTEALQGDVPVLVDFWAPWCPPCLKMGPVLDEVAGELAGKLKVVKVNTEDENALAMRFGIRALPTFLLFKNGQVKAQLVGARSKGELVETLAEHLG